MDAEDSTAVETDRSTASERVPISGAYNITTVGDSLKVGWWEDERRRIKWRNLRWWMLGLAIVLVPGWIVLFAPFHWTVVVGVMAVCAIPAARAFGWYVDVAHKHADMRLKRQQVRHR